MKYVLSAKELTRLANHVASETISLQNKAEGILLLEERTEVVKAVLRDWGIAWCDDE